MSLENTHYDAFISYRHCELDSFVSENLHKKLETYRMPKSVQKTLNPQKTKIERVFRDEAELPLSANLSDPITEALNNSDFLIVICTPRLNQSQWCRREVEHFVETHDREHVLLVLAEGEPEESFPEILMHEEVTLKDENGREVKVIQDREPLAADCRATTDRERLKALDNVVLKLCAAIFGLNYDDLKQRHRERQMRHRLIAMSAALAVVTVFALTCLSFMLKIGRQNRIIQDKYAGTMAAASQELLSEGLRKDALYAVRRVLPDKAEGYNPDALRAMVSALAPYEIENSYLPGDSFHVPQDMLGISLSEDGAYALVNAFGYSSLIDTGADTQKLRIDSEEAILTDTGIVFYDENGRVIHRDLEQDNETVLCENGISFYYAPGSRSTLVFSEGHIRGFHGIEESFDADLKEAGIYDEDLLVESICFTDDGKYAAFVCDTFDGAFICFLDLSEGRLCLTDMRDLLENPVVATDGSTIFLYYEEMNDYYEAVGIAQALDAESGQLLAETDISGEGFYSILLNDDKLMLVSDTISYVLDYDLSYVSSVTGYMDACTVFCYEYGFGILDMLGRVFLDGVFSSDEKSFSLYGHLESTFVSHAIYLNDSFYVNCVDTGRVVRYVPLGNLYEAMGDISDVTELADSGPAADLSALEDASELNVFCAAVTDDGKYTIVNTNDGTLHFYDAESGRKLKELYDTNILLAHKTCPFLKAADLYIVEKGVFDRDLNLISMLPAGGLAAKGADEKSVILRSRYSADTYYKITLLPYDELLKRTDELLKDYAPDRDIREKYNIVSDAEVQ